MDDFETDDIAAMHEQGDLSAFIRPQIRPDPEDLPHRPGPGPVSDPHQRCGRGRSAGHGGSIT